MSSLVIAWLVGEGILVYRSFQKYGHAPLPGQLLAASGVFILLGLAAQSEKLTFLAGALAWGFDLAAFLNIAPALLTGEQQAAKATAKSSTKTAPAGG